jgi:serine/threonine protein kinase/tetratricopeptide (TPR) repeat protein
MIPQVGHKFGPYEILGRLGSGGMGAVFRAWDGRLMREVGLKILHDDNPMPGNRERFLREARAASALNHPNICTIFDIGEQDGDPYLVMELLEGETIKSRVAHGALPVDELVRYAQEIAMALGAAHARGIIHRDIKPANIFLVDLPNGQRQAKVLDFGLAKFDRGSNSGHSMDLTSTGATVGTVAYMSPEQARGEQLDARSDLFSLGVVLYEMATRQVPFQGTTSALVFVQLLSQQPEPVRDWNDSIPKDLEKVIHKLLAKERKDRYQSATELYEALGKVGGKGGGGWFSKPAPASTPGVPLVRAADPVARARRPFKRPSGNYAPVHLEASREPFVPRTESAKPVADPDVVRPQRLTDESRGSQPSRQTAAHIPPPSRPPASQTPPPPNATSVLGSFPARSSGMSTPAQPPAGSPMYQDPGSRVSGMRDSGFTPRNVSYTEIDEDEDDDFEEPAADLPAGRLKRERRARRNRLIAAAVVLLLIGAGYWWYTNRGRFSPLLAAQDVLLVTTIQNKTGDETLTGAINAGLGIQLRQSPYLKIRGIQAYEAGLRLMGVDGTQSADPTLPQKVAQKLGAKAYLSGMVTGSGPYALSITVLDVASNQKLAGIDETAASREQLADAIGRISDTVRSDLGETGESISKNDVALRHEGTANIDALHALALAEAAKPYGRSTDVIGYYQKAATLDPKFADAQIGLAWAYQRQYAELAAADASRLAQEATENATDRTKLLAQYTYEMNASGDYNRALAVVRQILQTSPSDPMALEALARVLRLQGHLADALDAAQKSIESDPYRPEAYEEAELAMLGTDRYDAALQMEAQAQHAGLVHAGTHLLATYLVGRGDDAVMQFQNTLGTALPLAEGAGYGVYLDNTGQMTLGREAWSAVAAKADALKGLSSGAAYLLSQAALNRGLAGDCDAGLALARSASARGEGIHGIFNSAMTFALCGDSGAAQEGADVLAQTYPQSTAVTGFYLPDLNAAILLKSGDPAAALTALNSARPYDVVSLTPYLRGMAHVEMHDTKVGLVDFQIVLAHRGISAMNMNDMYPLAQLGEARTFAQSGDTGNAVTAYKKFIGLWPNGDVRIPGLAEALRAAK